jgi:hypothetical protein
MLQDVQIERLRKAGVTNIGSALSAMETSCTSALEIGVKEPIIHSTSYGVGLLGTMAARACWMNRGKAISGNLLAMLVKSQVKSITFEGSTKASHSAQKIINGSTLKQSLVIEKRKTGFVKSKDVRKILSIISPSQSKTGMGLVRASITTCSKSKVMSALYALGPKNRLTTEQEKYEGWLSIIAMKLARFVDSFVKNVTTHLEYSMMILTGLKPQSGILMENN